MLATELPSHAGDGRGDMAMEQCRCRVMLTIVLPSHAGDGDAEATWPWSDVDIESCWQWCC
jgi:hypothetical protein